ncbi:uncharacterized protein B0I36DRAFT_51649 [Microdochium trichocladiopsis]|uniref:Uncharacterized protein n=1 Tax=Microdochium trichocladiopsis TaxID=1682393 RepID=A0A9P8XRA0_9PEZI|nr:uncharacterized protein B0I36DRAFT_51649 [Microdochium trichocladiopsis]KAH7012513.1 hypothetical protein B0I36DRAFT_51649 [Microdochium trichocladiopsis]
MERSYGCSTAAEWKIDEAKHYLKQVESTSLDRIIVAAANFCAHDCFNAAMDQLGWWLPEQVIDKLCYSIIHHTNEDFLELVVERLESAHGVLLAQAHQSKKPRMVGQILRHMRSDQKIPQWVADELLRDPDYEAFHDQIRRQRQHDCCEMRLEPSELSDMVQGVVRAQKLSASNSTRLANFMAAQSLKFNQAESFSYARWLEAGQEHFRDEPDLQSMVGLATALDYLVSSNTPALVGISSPQIDFAWPLIREALNSELCNLKVSRIPSGDLLVDLSRTTTSNTDSDILYGLQVVPSGGSREQTAPVLHEQGVFTRNWSLNMKSKIDEQLLEPEDIVSSLGDHSVNVDETMSENQFNIILAFSTPFPLNVAAPDLEVDDRGDAVHPPAAWTVQQVAKAIDAALVEEQVVHDTGQQSKMK